jgi:hypothetical protein
MLTTIVDTVTAGRHRSTRVVRAVGVVHAAAPAARVACGQGWRQDTTGAGSSGGTELALASGVDSGSGRCRSWHRIASPAHPTGVRIDADVPGFPMAADFFWPSF